MHGIKDKIINVPINKETIKKTIESLPRTLEEASVVPLVVKRKIEYLSAVYKQYVRPEYIRKSAKFLQAVYPYYGGLYFETEKIKN
jgi:hypothetical protein